jgi:hypothetical protein
LKKNADVRRGFLAWKRMPLSALINYTWHAALCSAILELDPNKVSRRLDEATRAIDERMKMAIEPDDSEHQAIQEARSGIAMLKAIASNARPV